MAAGTSVHRGYLPSGLSPPSPRPLPLQITGYFKPTTCPPPIFISTNPTHLNPHHLKELYALCNHSCHGFPNVDAAGKVEPVDFVKLCTAVSHSSVVVSAFTKPEVLMIGSPSLTEESKLNGIGGEWIRKVALVTPENGLLIGFGRAVSDFGLTASIYDVMVHPALQGRGIGRMIVQRIVRKLTSKGVYDIAALCSAKERLFFRACGFGDDTLGSTTMMYSRVSASSSSDIPMTHAEMGKIWIEVCLISARGLRHASSLWKIQWFAVGWIDPNNKYCTKIDASGNGNPIWKTKFSTSIDSKELNIQDLGLHVEVYSREPIFLRQSLLGTATIALKEFLDKYVTKSEISKPVEEVGSFQLRKRNSNKPQGFVDVLIRISEEREVSGSLYLGGRQEFNLVDYSGGINLTRECGSSQPHRPELQTMTSQQLENIHPMPIPPNYSHLHPAAGGHSYQQTPPPPPPPPPRNIGYTPTILPGTENLQPTCINMPSLAAPQGRGGGGPGFAMGLGAGALAAGALIFGDDFLPGLDVPGNSRNASLTISTDPSL